MLTLFVIGFVAGIMAVIGLVKLTMREEPTGCVVVYGSLFLILFLSMILVLR